MTPRKLVGLIGSNIGGSLSPALHEDAFAAAGMVGHYHLMDVDALPGRRLNDLLTAARMAGFAGVNVTFPFKEAVIPLLDTVSPEAREIGAVNTVVIDADGRTTGHNTDRSGFRRAFLEQLGARVRARQAGPAAGRRWRRPRRGLCPDGHGRRPAEDPRSRRGAGERALCRPHGAFRRGTLHALERTRGRHRWTFPVSSTPRRSACGPSRHAADPGPIQPGQFVADVIYTPIETEFLRAARSKGARVMGGAGMCVHQAAEAFVHFTGRTPDVARMKRTFAEACARRDAVSSTA